MDKSNKIIEFPTKLRVPELPEWMQKAQDVWDLLDVEQRGTLLTWLMNIVQLDIKDSLSGKIPPGAFFTAVEEAYSDELGKCYLCSRIVDGNEEEFNDQRYLCLFCSVKVANILIACGVDHKKYFPAMEDRPVQKWRVEP